MMSLLHPYLDAFIAVAENRSITNGAKKLGLSQTAMTQKIKALERSLGFSVFTRKRTGIEFTFEGAKLFEHTLKIKAWEGEWNALSDNRIVTISGSSSLLRARIIPKLLTFLRQNAQLKIQFDLIDNISAISRLQSGYSQIVIVKPEEVMLEMDSKILKSERYIMVGPEIWKNRKISDILQNESIIDLDQNDKMTLDFLKKYNLKHNPKRYFVNNTDAILSLIESTLGFSVLSEEFALDALNSNQIVNLCPGKYLDVKTALAFYPRIFMPEYLKQIIHCICKS